MLHQLDGRFAGLVVEVRIARYVHLVSGSTTLSASAFMSGAVRSLFVRAGVVEELLQSLDGVGLPGAILQLVPQ